MPRPNTPSKEKGPNGHVKEALREEGSYSDEENLECMPPVARQASREARLGGASFRSVVIRQLSLLRDTILIEHEREVLARCQSSSTCDQELKETVDSLQKENDELKARSEFGKLSISLPLLSVSEHTNGTHHHVNGTAVSPLNQSPFLTFNSNGGGVVQSNGTSEGSYSPGRTSMQRRMSNQSVQNMQSNPNGHMLSPSMTDEEEDDGRYMLLTCWCAQQKASVSSMYATNSAAGQCQEDEVQEVSELPFPRCVLHPNSDLFLTWQILFTLILCYELIMFPMEEFNIPQDGFIYWANWLCVVFWTLDLFLTFCTGFRAKDGALVMDHSKIAVRYFKSWFFPDTLVVGVDWIILASAGDGSGALKFGKTLRYLRIARLLRLLRLRKLKEAMRALDDYANSLYFTIIKSLVVNMLGILVISHFLGCLWFTVGNMKIPGYTSWVEAYEFENAEWMYSYLTCLHWAICQFTPGSMHIQPQNVPERVMGVVMLVMGMMIFSSIVSNITAATRDLKNITARFDMQFATLRRFFKQEHISMDLLAKVSMYAENVIKAKFNTVAKNDVDLFKWLPEPLEKEVIRELYDQYLEVHPLFRAIHQQSLLLLQKICCEVQQIVMSAGACLFSPGENARNMYFLYQGRMFYSMKRAAKKEFIDVDGNFPEPVLWTSWVLQGRMVAAEHSDLIALDTERFQKISMGHPMVMVWLKNYAQDFCQELNNRALGGNVVDDLIKIQAAVDCLPDAPARHYANGHAHHR